MDNDKYQGNGLASLVVKRTPTSINIDEDLWVELKILALRKKTTATELLEKAVRDLLSREGRK
jgi:predicted transcriptional regulator